MSATANPHFDLQHQAIASLRQIHRICLALEGSQLAASIVALTLGYLSRLPSLPRILHLYSSIIYVFLAIFAHVVVYYVLLAMSRNVSSAAEMNPGSVNDWLVVATSRQKTKLLPFFAAHALTLTAAVVSNSFWSTSHSKTHPIGAWSAVVVGAIVFGRVWLVLRRNTEYLTSFVTTGGFSNLPSRNL